MATANLTDMSILMTDTVFGNRVAASLAVYCTINVPADVVGTGPMACQIHIARKNYASLVSNNPANYKAQFVLAVACNQIVANDATASGTLVGLTPTQVAAAAALCTDTDINNAVSSAFNALIGGI